MGELFRRLFHIFPGEGKKACLFAFLGFLWSFAVTGVQKYADSLFVLHIGASELPTAYMYAACGMMLLATLLMYAFHTYAVHRIYLAVLFVGITFYSCAYMCFQFEIGLESAWLWFALRVFGFLLFTVSVTCYWSFIDQFFELSDAKRLYSLFSSMIFLGAGTTGSVMRTGIVDFQHLILGVIAILIFTAFLILHVKNDIPMRKLDITDDEPEPFNLPAFFKNLMKSRYALLVMTGNFITFLLMVITEFNYMDSLDTYFTQNLSGLPVGTEENASLTLFMGQCIAGVSMSNLIIGLFVYSRILKRYGIGSLLMCTPIILVMTFSGWLITDSIIFSVIGIFVVEGTLYVIDDSNFNLLLTGLPRPLKYKTRVFIEAFFEPVAMLMSSLLLSVPQIDSRLVGLSLAGCALIVAWTLKDRFEKKVLEVEVA